MSLEKNSKLEWVSVKKLKENPRNNNKHPKLQIERLAKIIKYQGFRSPITVSNLSGYIVSGHARLKAAKLLGLKEVPVSYQDFDSEEQEYAHLTADNASALWSELDMPSIADFVKEDSEASFDLDFLGFKNLNLEQELEKEKQKPKPPQEKIKVESGDIWRLGKHKLYCGSSTRQAEKIINNWVDETGGEPERIADGR